MITTTVGLDNISAHCKLFSHLPGIYYRLRYHNLHWSVIHVTHQAAKLLGYTEQEVYDVASTFLEIIILPEDLEMVTERKKEALQSERLFDLEFRIRTKNGEVKYVRDQYIVYAESGDWIMEGYLSETVKSQLRDRLLQQLRSYREAVDVNMISSITDKKGIIVYANENFCQISKYKASELIGQNHNIVNSGHHSSEFFKSLWDKITSGQTWHGEILNRAKDGTLYWVDTVIIPIFDETRKIVNYLSLRTLVNERMEAEVQRKKYTHLLEQIAFIVAHNIRGPLCSILGLADILLRQDNTLRDIEKAVTFLQESAQRLDEITHRLSKFVEEHDLDSRLKDYEKNDAGIGMDFV